MAQLVKVADAEAGPTQAALELVADAAAAVTAQGMPRRAREDEAVLDPAVPRALFVLAHAVGHEGVPHRVGQPDRPLAALGLGLLEPRDPARFPHERVVDRDGAGLLVDVLRPAQGQDLAQPRPDRQRDEEQRPEPVVLDRAEDRGQLGIADRLPQLPAGPARRLGIGRNRCGNPLLAARPLERGPQRWEDLDPHGPAPAVALEVVEPVLDLGDREGTGGDVPEVRVDVQPDVGLVGDPRRVGEVVVTVSRPDLGEPAVYHDAQRAPVVGRRHGLGDGPAERLGPGGHVMPRAAVQHLSCPGRAGRAGQLDVHGPAAVGSLVRRRGSTPGPPVRLVARRLRRAHRRTTRSRRPGRGPVGRCAPTGSVPRPPAPTRASGRCRGGGPPRGPRRAAARARWAKASASWRDIGLTRRPSPAGPGARAGRAGRRRAASRPRACRSWPT